ncbi:hypothetical protein CVT24_012862 [Panaeolus cyanescens]|uniref:Uncharacterized protein n=1 Tax=Panaeolus cyanescens TaxID=181874 RepID=A0A409X0S2_9AGAR|nr:hypothetical protein CVT24_012862 [Panaeolus cyanescens]
MASSGITVITPDENTKVIVLVPANRYESIDKYLDPADLEEEANEEAAGLDVGRTLSDVESTNNAEVTTGSPLDNLPPVPGLDLYDFRDYIPSNTAVIWSGLEQIYSAPLQNMYGRVSRHLENIHWEHITSWNNQTSLPQAYQISYTTSLRITEGSEKETETTTSTTVTITINVPAHTLLVFYQRRYDFRDETNFSHFRDRRNRSIAVWNAHSPLERKISRVQIMSEEYFTSTRHLPPGPGSVHITGVPQAQLPSETIRRNDTMPRARRNLSWMGL